MDFNLIPIDDDSFEIHRCDPDGCNTYIGMNLYREGSAWIAVRNPNYNNDVFVPMAGYCHGLVNALNEAKRLWDSRFKSMVGVEL